MASPAETIVVIEDDHHIADLVAMYLRQDGYRAIQAETGEAGLDAIRQERAALAIVDIGLPGAMSGLDVCRLLRADSDVPVVLLTARDDEIDRVLGLELGADDYVTKPFSARELMARVRAILRRAAGPADRQLPPILVVGQIQIDLGRREVRLLDEHAGPGTGEPAAGRAAPPASGAPVALTAREFDLLAELAANLGLVLSRRQLLDGAWGTDWYGDERTVDVHVRQLRKKLGDCLPLATVWGIGYRLA